jgi:predicted phage-related endonuclease
MSDFAPEIRNSAWWSGDSRLAANGKANDAVLVKLGLLDPPDLSGVEAVQMGHVMEPVIGQLASQKLGIGLRKLDDSRTHPKHSWFRSHFDFVGDLNGETVLVECKNYNAAVRNKFDPDNCLMPDADRAQVIHEAAVYGVQTVYLAVLFGGQEFTLTKVNISDTEKEDLIKTMAQYWAAVQSKQPLPPETVEQAKAMFPYSEATAKPASRSVEEACTYLRAVKEQIKALEAKEEALQVLVQGYMAQHDTLTGVDGSVLATWKQAKPGKRFDAKLFEQAMPDIYRQFVRETEGSRRFLIK